MADIVDRSWLVGRTPGKELSARPMLDRRAREAVSGLVAATDQQQE